MVTPQKRVLIGILVAGIITATITTLAVTKVFNSATAQFQVPLQIQPRLQQQQPAAAATNTGPSFGPSCTGCVTTQNLANEAVTNPKLAVPSVSSANIGAGQVATANIADSAVTTQKIASGAVTLSSTSVSGNAITVAPGIGNGDTVSCPSGTIVTGGGAQLSTGLELVDSFGRGNNWAANAFNPTSSSLTMIVVAECTSIHP